MAQMKPEPRDIGSEVPRCPHCNQPLTKWRTPELTSWGGEIHLVCFNDQCPYFVEGWEWMATQFHVVASYRYKLDPKTGEEGPLPVWSVTALKDRIVEDE